MNRVDTCLFVPIMFVIKLDMKSIFLEIRINVILLLSLKKRKENVCPSVNLYVLFLRADNGVQSKVRFSCADPEVRQSNTEENFTL